MSTNAYELILGVASDEEHEMQSMRRMVEGKRVDGMILTLIREQDPRVGYLLDRDFPFVLYGRTRETRPYAFVDMDGKQAFKKAFTYLAYTHQNLGENFILNFSPIKDP
jgi:LacI family transcriptional regulator